MKICILIPCYSVLSWIGIAWPNTYVYLLPWIEFFQAFAVGSFFLLLCEFVSPSSQWRDVFFAALEMPAKKKGKKAGQKVDGLEFYRVSCCLHQVFILLLD